MAIVRKAIVNETTNEVVNVIVIDENETGWKPDVGHILVDDGPPDNPATIEGRYHRERPVGQRFERKPDPPPPPEPTRDEKLRALAASVGMTVDELKAALRE